MQILLEITETPVVEQVMEMLLRELPKIKLPNCTTGQMQGHVISQEIKPG